jgi:hypothetical protein
MNPYPLFKFIGVDEAKERSIGFLRNLRRFSRLFANRRHLFGTCSSRSVLAERADRALMFVIETIQVSPGVFSTLNNPVTD